MIQDIAHLPVFDLPLVVIVGIVTLLLFVITATIALADRRGRKWASFTLHYRFAVFSLFLGVVHIVLALSVYIGY